MAQPSLKLREQDLAQDTTELPRRFPLVISPENRSSSTAKDAKLVNCYTEKNKKTGEYAIFGWPGLLESVSVGAASGLGAYTWLSHTYAIFGAKIYKDGVDMGAAALNTAGGRYRFDESLNPQKLIFGNGTKAYTTDGATVAEITDFDFPTSFVKGWSFLDATNYVGVGSTASIYGSDLNDPTAWDPLNKIVVQIEPDPLMAIAKQLVYTVALKQWSAEVFYDAGNSTGSPLGRVQGAKISYGCIHAETVTELNGVLLWAATYRKGNQASYAVQVVMMDNLKVKVVSTPAEERVLQQADFTDCFSFGLVENGHRLYVLTVKNSNFTLVYDLDEDMWHYRTDASGNYFPYVSATSGSAGTRILQHETDGKLYLCDSGYVTDNGSVITKDIITPNFDGGVRWNKTLDRLQPIADQTPGSLLQVRCNDFDYDPAKWSNWREVDLGKQEDYLDNCGTFKRRVYHFQQARATRFRLFGMDMRISMGTI